VNYLTLGRKHITMWNFDTRKKELNSTKLILTSFKSTTKKVPLFYSSAASVDEYFYVHTEPGDVYKMKDNVSVGSLGLFETGSGVCIRSPDGLAIVGVGKSGPRLVFWHSSELIGEQFPAPSVSFELKEQAPADFYPIGGTFHKGEFVVQSKNRQVWSFNKDAKKGRLLIDCHNGSTTAVATSPLGNLVATVSTDKTLRIWNDTVKTLQAERKFDLLSGGSAVAYSPAGDMLAVGLDNGQVNIIKDSTFAKSSKISGDGINCLAFSPDGSLLAVSSHDMTVYILTVPGLELKGKMKGNTASVLHLQWSDDGSVIQTDSLDFQIIYFGLTDFKRIDRLIEIMDAKWPKWHCTLGWPMQGVFNQDDDSYNVNNVDVNPAQSVIAAGDDFGLIRLYRYPTLVPSQKHKASIGHSSHVTDLRFNAEGNKLFSTGGNDTTVLEWDVVA